MRTVTVITLAALLSAGDARAAGGSVTLAGMLDGSHGSSIDADLHWYPLQAWSVGAGIGHSKSELTGSDFAGTSLRASTDLQLGDFNAGVSMQYWNDSSQIRTISTRGQVGWTSLAGFGINAIVDDRHMRVTYTTQPVVGQSRDIEANFDGTGFGAELAWYGEQWNSAARFIGYSYGQNVDRLRTIVNSPTTSRFPRLAVLVGSVTTRAAGAPDREIGATLGREFSKSSLQGDWTLQRDALTGVKYNSLSLVLGYHVTPHLELDTTGGFSHGGTQGTVAYGGLSLTLRR